MLKLKEGIKVFVSTVAVDARKSIDGLSGLVQELFGNNPQSGDLFVFVNKGRDKAKILCWEQNGFMLHYKRLEKHRFKIPKLDNDQSVEITETQLYGLLAGLDFMLMGHFTEVNYTQYY